MRLIYEGFNGFVQHGGFFFLIIILFMVGFIIKTLGSLCYDDILDKIENFQLRKSDKVSLIINAYEKEKKLGKTFTNIEAFVEREMHMWKTRGMYVEKANNIGDIFGKICLICGVCMSVYIMSTTKIAITPNSQPMQRVYTYLGSSIILNICLKLWDCIIAIDYKRSTIKDEIINYLENHPSTKEVDKAFVSVEVNLSEEKNDVQQEINLNSQEMQEVNLQEKRKKMINKLKLEENNRKIHCIKNDDDTEKKPVNKEIDSGFDKEVVFSEILDEFLS